MKAALAVLLCTVYLVLTPKPAHATYYEQDSEFIYQITPYTEAIESSGYSPAIIETSLRVFQNFLIDLIESGDIPSNIETFEDLKQLRASDKDITLAMANLNEWIEQAKATAPGFLDQTDFFPDAFLVFGGGKFSANLGIGGGGSVTLGMVIMPVYVKKMSKFSGEVVDEYSSASASLVAWGSPDLGTGVGGGARGRVGFGLLWNTNSSFTRPDQFVGAGVGLSTTLAAGVGLNLKAGILNNASMRDWVDFVYATAAWEFGAVAEASLHINGTVILPVSAILRVFDSSTQSIFNEKMDDLERELEKRLRERLGTTLAEVTDPRADVDNPLEPPIPGEKASLD